MACDHAELAKPKIVRKTKRLTTWSSATGKRSIHTVGHRVSCLKRHPAARLWCRTLPSKGCFRDRSKIMREDEGRFSVGKRIGQHTLADLAQSQTHEPSCTLLQNGSTEKRPLQ